LGQLVDVSMLESMLTLTLPEMQFAQFNVPPPGRHLFGPVATAEGFISVAAASERTFQGLAAAAGRLDWLTDPRFAAYPDRRANWDKLMDELEAWAKRRGTAECLGALDANSVRAAAYRTVREAMNDPQLAHRSAFSEVRDASGAFRALNPPFRMSGSAACAGSHAPALGEHTRSVRRTAGFSDAEIDALINAAGTAD
jgi:CoA:oxalate CoA-transferase